MYGTLKKIFAFAGSKKGLLKKSLLFSFLSGLFSAIQFAALFVVIGALVSDNRDGKFICISLGIMAVSLIGRIITTYFSTMEQTETGYCMVAEKRIHIGDRLRYIPMGYFNKNSIGNITAIVTTTLGDVENSAARVLVSVLGGFFNSVALVIVLLVFDWRIGLVAAAGVLIYLAAAELALRKSAALSGVRQHTQESLVESVLEYIQGMGIVKAFGLEQDSTQSIGSAIKASCRDNLKLTKASVPYDAIKQAVVRVFSVLLLLASVWFWLDGSLSLAYGLILVIASFMVFNDLENAGNMASLLQMLAASMDTANSIDDTPVMDEKGTDITPKSSEIVFDKVDFSYADRKILDQVSFTIPEKTTTAIVGPSGAGKTTMCNLIARFWDVNAGKITIGGTDVRDFKLDSLMKNISMVFQSVYLFADTIENNIKFGCPDATHEQVVEAAKKACCHDFISALPDGYDTVIGEGGGTLSGGEKQRISIARAMLKDAPIIILDEATSSVDPENEDELQRAIEALTHDKTMLKEGFYHRPLTVIRPIDIENFLKGMRRDGRSDSYISKARGMLYQIFQKAEANDLVRRNPVRLAEKMRASGTAKRKEAFTTAEVAHLMKVLPDDRMGLSIRLLLGTGMRMQELLALEPQFIEEDGSVIHIRQAVKVVKGTVSIGSPKSKDSIRDIPVPLNVRPCAIKLRDTTDQFIWESPKTGLPCNPTHFRDVFRKSLEEAGDVRLLTPHSCRHTYVSQMQALGVDIQTIQSIVGHADTEMTEHYLHVQESIRQSAIQLFSEAFSA